MSYFRKLTDRLAELLALFKKDDRWLILVNADPDALGSAMALRRIMSRRVGRCAIAHINAISRPDNLAMIRYLRIPTRMYTPELAAGFNRFAMVDSQPHHNPIYKNHEYTVVLDHHPTSEKSPVKAAYAEIRTEYGACATLLTEYLYNLKIEPGKLLATALLYGIKSDTQDFEREFCDVDVKAFRYLNKHANHDLIRMIVRSEFRLDWLKYFAWAFRHLQIVGDGIVVYMHKVHNPDILVILADFFLRVHEINWTVVVGKYEDQLVVIFRGDGLSRHVGEMARKAFGDVGSAGGHKAAARAEVPLAAIGGMEAERFVLSRIDPENLERFPREATAAGYHDHASPLKGKHT